MHSYASLVILSSMLCMNFQIPTYWIEMKKNHVSTLTMQFRDAVKLIWTTDHEAATRLYVCLKKQLLLSWNDKMQLCRCCPLPCLVNISHSPYRSKKSLLLQVYSICSTVLIQMTRFRDLFWQCLTVSPASSNFLLDLQCIDRFLI